jgi:hypothetical protein
VKVHPKLFGRLMSIYGPKAGGVDDVIEFLSKRNAETRKIPLSEAG